MKKQKKVLVYIILGFITLNLVASQFFYRFDFTSDQRYSLSETSINFIENIDKPVVAEIYLSGDLPSEFKQLEQETQFLFEEYQAYNPLLKFRFNNPLNTSQPAEEVANRFFQKGMTPERLNQIKNGKTVENWIFPWAEIKMGTKKVEIPLLQKKLGASTQEIIKSSIQNLEYQITNALIKLTREKEKKVAVLRGNGQLEDAYLADYIQELGKYYRIAPFTLKTVVNEPNKTLSELKKFDLIIDAKPTQKFTEAQKYCLDQFIMDGGKAIWLTEQINAEKDSLMQSGSMVVIPRDLNTYDLFFTYGVRINPTLVNDLYSAPIILAQGSGSQTQFNPFPWFYEPLADAASNHPTVNNINAVHFDFANVIEFLEREQINQIPLLKSSNLTKLEGAPKEIKLSQVQDEVNPEEYNAGTQVLAGWVEGSFKSLYQNRVLPFSNSEHIEISKVTQQVFIADGDVIKNEIRKGKVQELGFDRYTGNVYGNKSFLMNVANYLLGDEDLVKLRTKSVQLPKLDSTKIENTKNSWKLVLLVSGLLFVGGVSYSINLIRKKKYLK